MSDWRIKKWHNGCADCGREFEEEEAFYSFLLLEAEAFGREDRCVACFEKGGARSGSSIFWKTRRPPEGKRRLALDFEVVEQLFMALRDREEERLQELAYLLSLLLLRKKRLKLVRVSRDEAGEAMVLRRPRRTEALSVRVFDLPEERAGVLRDELARIFEGAEISELLAGPPDPEPPAEPLEEEQHREVESHEPEETPAS